MLAFLVIATILVRGYCSQSDPRGRHRHPPHHQEEVYRPAGSLVALLQEQSRHQQVHHDVPHPSMSGYHESTPSGPQAPNLSPRSHHLEPAAPERRPPSLSRSHDAHVILHKISGFSPAKNRSRSRRPLTSRPHWSEGLSGGTGDVEESGRTQRVSGKLVRWPDEYIDFVDQKDQGRRPIGSERRQIESVSLGSAASSRQLSVAGAQRQIATRARRPAEVQRQGVGLLRRPGLGGRRPFLSSVFSNRPFRRPTSSSAHLSRPASELTSSSLTRRPAARPHPTGPPHPSRDRPGSVKHSRLNNQDLQLLSTTPAPAIRQTTPMTLTHVQLSMLQELHSILGNEPLPLDSTQHGFGTSSRKSLQSTSLSPRYPPFAARSRRPNELLHDAGPVSPLGSGLQAAVRRLVGFFDSEDSDSQSVENAPFKRDISADFLPVRRLSQSASEPSRSSSSGSFRFPVL